MPNVVLWEADQKLEAKRERNRAASERFRQRRQKFEEIKGPQCPTIDTNAITRRQRDLERELQRELALLRYASQEARPSSSKPAGSLSAKLSWASRSSTNSSSGASRAPSVFSEALTQRSSTYSWISSRSTHPPPEFESAEETEVQPAKKDSEPEEIELTKEETKEKADPANEEMNPAEDEVEIAKEDEIEREAASECKNDLLSAETKAAVGLKQDSQVHGGYWCTACHNRYSERQSWQLHEEHCYERKTQCSCKYCGETLYSESQVCIHHREKHACSPCHCAERQNFIRSAELGGRRAGWGCGFCAAYLGGWEERSEHVGGHFEAGSRMPAWKYSNVIRGLLRQPKLAQHWLNLLIERHGPDPEQGITVHFSEPGSGQSSHCLREILEYGGLWEDPMEIARLAYNHGVRPHLSGAMSSVTVAKTESAIMSWNLDVTEASKEEPVSPAKPLELLPSSVYINPSLELKPGPTPEPQPVVPDTSNDPVPSAGSSPNLVPTSPSRESTSDLETCSVSESSGEPTETTNSAGSSPSGKLVQEGVDAPPPLSLASDTGVKKCAPAGDSSSPNTTRSFSNSISSSNSGVPRRGDFAGGPRGGRKIGGDDEDDDDGESNSLQLHDGETRGKKLACPYFKRNPDVYSGTKYRLCKYSGFASVHRLK
jgi:hypothetical protein